MKIIVQKEIIKTVCDECQKEIDFNDQLELGAKLNFDFGYYSDRDQQSKEIHLCQHCAEKLIKIIDEKMHLDMDKNLKESSRLME